jgi:hypothetical protein
VEDLHACAPGCLRGRIQKPTLPYAGVSLYDDQSTLATAGIRQRGQQLIQLCLALEQRGLRSRCHLSLLAED